MKQSIQAVNFEMAEHLEKYIAKKIGRFEKKLLPSAEVEIRMTVVKPETNLNKETTIRIFGEGPELFVHKTCDTFEQGIDECIEVLERKVEKIKNA